ncbi:MAG TPA: hypothetical protein VH857_03630 [Actinomycetes bacterium]|nr:hypothetical protein [Actinomycetes bacterium]
MHAVAAPWHIASSDGPFAMQAGLIVHWQSPHEAFAAVARPRALALLTPGNCTPVVTTAPPA